MSTTEGGVEPHHQRTRYRVTGMDCGSCATKITTALRRVPGVHQVGVSVPSGTVTVTHTPSLPSDAIVQPLSALGFGASNAEVKPTERDADAVSGHGHDHRHGAGDGAWWSTGKGRLVIASGAALVLSYAVGMLVPSTGSWAFLLAMAVGLVPTARRAICESISM